MNELEQTNYPESYKNNIAVPQINNGIIIIDIYIAHYSHCALMRFFKKQLYPY